MAYLRRKNIFSSGERMRTFKTSYGKIAILVCADSWHPVLPYISALDGASIFIHTVASFEKGLGEVAANKIFGLMGESSVLAIYPFRPSRYTRHARR